MNSNNKPSGLLTKPKRYPNVAHMIRDVSEDKKLAEDTAAKIESQSIVNFLIGLRTVHNLSQSEMAKKMGCTQSKISKLERGADDNLSIGDFRAYTQARGLEMTINLSKKGQTIANRVNAHTFAVRRLMIRAAELSGHQDGSIAKGSRKLLISTIGNLAEAMGVSLKVLQNAIDALPTKLPIEQPRLIEMQPDESDEAKSSEIMSGRKSAFSHS